MLSSSFPDSHLQLDTRGYLLFGVFARKSQEREYVCAAGKELQLLERANHQGRVVITPSSGLLAVAYSRFGILPDW